MLDSVKIVRNYKTKFVCLRSYFICNLNPHKNFGTLRYPFWEKSNAGGREKEEEREKCC
jgi:hypothetical protein